MSLADFIQDPGEDKDYTLDYTAWLTGGETITTSTWVSTTPPAQMIGGLLVTPVAITIEEHTNTNTAATVYVSGGTAGFDYKMTNTIVTSANPTRTTVQSIIIQVRTA